MKSSWNPGHSKICFSIVLVWLVLYSYRFFHFGFYSDDYITFFEPFHFHPKTEWLHYFTDLYANRIISGFLSYFLLITAKTNAFLWHLFGALVMLAETFLFYKIFRILNDKEEDKSLLAMVACLWLANPFSFGFTAWPTYMIHNCNIIFFLFSIIVYLRGHFLGSLMLFLLSGLTHESYYFQFFLIVGLSIIYQKNRQKTSTHLKHAAIFLLAQLSLIAYNRLTQAGNKKQMKLDFIWNRIQGVIQNPQYWFEAMIPVAILGFFIYFLFRSVRKIKSGSLKPLESAILLVLFCGVLNVLVYLSVGYSIRPFGLASKTTITVSTLFLFLIFAISKEVSAKTARKIVIGLYVVFLPLFVSQTIDWARSWDLQQDVIAKFPTTTLVPLKEDAAILVIVPNRAGHMVVFEESSAFAPAIRNYHQEMRYTGSTMLSHHFGTFSATTSTYDGDQVLQTSSLSSHRFGSPPGIKKVYIWNYFDGTLRVTDKPFALENDLSSSHLDALAGPAIEVAK